MGGWQDLKKILLKLQGYQVTYETIPSGVGTLKTLTAGTSNAKGVYTELLDPTTKAYTIKGVVLGVVSAVDKQYEVDVAIGADGSESVKAIVTPGEFYDANDSRVIPLEPGVFVPTGSRLAARCACETNSATIEIKLLTAAGLRNL